MARTVPAMLFDLDGTLVDSVYQHVGAWHEALTACGIPLSVWRIHRKIGMSGGLFVRGLMRELGRELDPDVAVELRRKHATAYAARFDGVVALPGARELLATLTALRAPWAIATSGGRDVANRTLALLDIPPDVPVVTRDEVVHAKPDPDLFLAAAEKLGVAIEHSIVVGDSVWDLLAARRAGALGVGLLSGGYGYDELQSGGAYRVYEDPATYSGISTRLEFANRIEPGWRALRRAQGDMGAARDAAPCDRSLGRGVSGAIGRPGRSPGP